MKSGMSSSVVALLFFQLLIAMSTFNISSCYGRSYVGCVESESKALLRFKGDLKDPSNRLSSWIADTDCCKWAGIVCNNFTGNVIRLHLRNPFNYEIVYEAFERSSLVGEINTHLLELKHLLYLDLSGNNFSPNNQIPRFLGSLTNLEYLNLSFCGFGGLIPPQLGNLSNLQYLDLNQESNVNGLYVENLNWLSGLSLLEHLDLTSVNLAKASSWLLDINTLPHLLVLKLSNCDLSHFPLPPIANFSSLAILDLSHNNFDEYFIPAWIFGLGDLIFLDLSFNYFNSPIPEGLQNLTSLRHLDLSWNYFNSSVPNWFYRFSHLEYLSLSCNSLSGITLGNIANLTSLQTIDLSYNNKLTEKIPTSWKRLCNLKSIILSRVNLSQVISEILDIFSGCISVGLESLDMSHTQLSRHLTNQIGKLKNVRTVNFRYNSISGPIPMCLGELSSLKFLDFSYNRLTQVLSEIHFYNLSSLVHFDVCENSLELKVSRDWIPPFQLNLLGLRSCKLGLRFPLWLSSQKHLNDIDMSNSNIDDRVPIWFWKSSSLKFLDLSHNQIHGVLPNLTMPSIWYFDLSSNKFSGSLPFISTNAIVLLDLSNNAFSGSVFHFFCMNGKEPMSIEVLHLQNNLLSGELPNCWSNWQLQILNLGNNEFTGILPTSMKTLNSLVSIHLQRNNFSKRIPVSFQSWTSLEVLDLSENELMGNVPTWIGESLLSLKILNLHSNNFHGHLPLELCHLGNLQILDLADNNLSGIIPKCVSNFSAMVTVNKIYESYLYIDSVISVVSDNALVMMKGQAVEYNANLNLVRSIDLSRNNFSGEIPLEVMNLGALQSFNLSHNSLTGTIPKSIGAMKSLESIDFSANQLSGKIPQSFSNLTFLSYLNLSNNKLVGEIPLSTQLQGFDPSYFVGNELCGSPLPKKCAVEVPKSENGNGVRGEDGDDHEVNWGFYVSMAVGFVMGFWGVVGPLFVSRRWRGTYYSFLNKFWDKFYIVVLRRYCY